MERSAITDELRQKKPFPSAHQEAAVSLLRTADLVRRIVGAILDDRAITLQQYNVLRILRGAGSKGLPTLDIAERMVEATPGITRLLDRLEAKGLVSRARCAEDRRQVLCCITPAGLALADSLDEPVNRANLHALSALDRAELATFMKLMDKVRAAHSDERSHTP